MASAHEEISCGFHFKNMFNRKNERLIGLPEMRYLGQIIMCLQYLLLFIGCVFEGNMNEFITKEGLCPSLYLSLTFFYKNLFAQYQSTTRG